MSRGRCGARAAYRIAKTMRASRAAYASRLALPKMPWMRPPSNRLSRDQYTIGSDAFSTGITKRGSSGPPMKTETQTSKRSDRATTHLHAEAIARTSSCHVSTAAMNIACSVVMASSSSVTAVVAGHALHRIDARANSTYATANQGSLRHCTGGRVTIHTMPDTMPEAIATTVVTISPVASTHAVPAMVVNSTKTHQARSSSSPVRSRTGGAGGAETGWWVWTAMV